MLSHTEQILMCKYLRTWTWVLFPQVLLLKASGLAGAQVQRTKNQMPPLVGNNGKVTVHGEVYIKTAGIIMDISTNNPHSLSAGYKRSFAPT